MDFERSVITDIAYLFYFLLRHKCYDHHKMMLVLFLSVCTSVSGAVITGEKTLKRRRLDIIRCHDIQAKFHENPMVRTVKQACA
jgi:hypothetical protein